MIDQLETELREALGRRAAEVRTDAVDRLRRIDYKPRTTRRWPLTVSAVGVASGTAAALSVVVLGGSQPAFAGWSAQPTPPAQLQSATTPADCQTQVATVPGGSDRGGWSQVASDTRGPYTMVVYENGNSLASCFSGPSFTTVQAESFDSTNGGMAVSASEVAAPGPHVSSNEVQLLSGGDIDQLLVSHLSQDGDGPYTLVEGRVASTVSSVALVLSDGQRVTATTGSGWVVAWWPAGQDVISAQISSSTGGTVTEPLTKSSFPKPPPPTGGSGSTPTHGSPGGPPPPPVANS